MSHANVTNGYDSGLCDKERGCAARHTYPMYRVADQRHACAACVFVCVVVSLCYQGRDVTCRRALVRGRCTGHARYTAVRWAMLGTLLSAGYTAVCWAMLGTLLCSTGCARW